MDALSAKAAKWWRLAQHGAYGTIGVLAMSCGTGAGTDIAPNKPMATAAASEIIDGDPAAPPRGRTVRAPIDNGTGAGVVTYREFDDQANAKIIGTNDLVPVVNDGANLPESLRPLIDAFGMIDMGCTATHIGNGLVLTAGHCFDAPATPATNVSCAGHTVRWGFRKDKASYLTSNCEVIVAEQLTDNIDYAIFRVSPVPPVAVAVDLTRRVPDSTRITIFGHPQMRPLEWSQYCTVEPGSRGNWGTAQFSHQCDTEPGNSGSTIIDATTMKVVGIHDGGLVPWNYASYLFDTPLASIIGGGGSTGGSSGGATGTSTGGTSAGSTGSTTGGTTGGTNVPNQSFGPFAHNLSETLIEMGAGIQGTVSFTFSYNVEQGYDYVYVRDGSGRERRYTGSGNRRFAGGAALKTPVRVRIVTDDSVTSQSVGISDVSF